MKSAPTVRTDTDRLSRSQHWHGALTAENAMALRDRIEQLLQGKRYSYTTTYVGPSGYVHQTMRTSQVADKFTCTISEMNSGRPCSSIMVHDSYGLWFLDSTLRTRAEALAMEYDARMLAGPYVVLSHSQIQFQTRLHDGATNYVTVAVEQDYDVLSAARDLLSVWDSHNTPGVEMVVPRDLRDALRWLREAVEPTR